MLGIFPLTGLPEIRPGDDLPGLLAAHLAELRAGDILVVAQKIVSKAEGRFVTLSDVVPSPEAVSLAGEVRKDARLVELVLRESSQVVRAAPHVLITRHRLGHVMANAGIDASNLGNAGKAGGEGRVLLLPDDPDASAARIGDALEARFGVRPGVVISDSFGRPWRMGTVNVAIGIAGMPALIDRRGEPDRDGRVMQMTLIALADAVAAAAGLAMGEGAEGVPAAVVRGLGWAGAAQTAGALLRPVGEDLFR